MSLTALVDRDGTLFSTCEANLVSWEKATSLLEIPFHNEHQELVVSGAHFDAIARCIGLQSTTQMNELASLRRSIFLDCLKLTELNEQLLTFLLSEFSQVVLVTNASSESTRSLLDRWSHKFAPSGVVTGDSIVHGKPSPEIYFETLRRFYLNQFEVRVFEDSQIGITAALSAGLSVIPVDHFCNLPQCQLSVSS